MRARGASLLVIAVLWAGLGAAPVAGHDATQKTPETQDIPPGGLARNFALVGHNPLLDSNQGSSQVDVQAFRITLGLSYRLSRYVNIFGGYDYIRQRTGSKPTIQVDGDQNRVRVGIQVGYPFSLD